MCFINCCPRGRITDMRKAGMEKLKGRPSSRGGKISFYERGSGSLKLFSLTNYHVCRSNPEGCCGEP